MSNKILIIGVGSAGINAVDKMDLPSSKKLFVGSNCRALREVKSEVTLFCRQLVVLSLQIGKDVAR